MNRRIASTVLGVAIVCCGSISGVRAEIFPIVPHRFIVPGTFNQPVLRKVSVLLEFKGGRATTLTPGESTEGRRQFNAKVWDGLYLIATAFGDDKGAELYAIDFSGEPNGERFALIEDNEDRPHGPREK